MSETMNEMYVRRDMNVLNLRNEMAKAMICDDNGPDESFRQVGFFDTDKSDAEVDQVFQSYTDRILSGEYRTFRGYSFTEDDDIYKVLKQIGKSFFYQKDWYGNDAASDFFSHKNMRQYGILWVPADETDEEVDARLQHEIDLIIEGKDFMDFEPPITFEQFQCRQDAARKYGINYLKYGLDYCKEHFGK